MEENKQGFTPQKEANNDKYLGDLGTPASIIDLAIKVLDIKKGESVADFGAGYGNFLLKVGTTIPQVELYGNEISVEVAKEARQRLQGIVAEENFKTGDMFKKQIAFGDKKFDKVFSNYPFGIKIDEKYIEKIAQLAGTQKRKTASNWAFNNLMVEKIKDNGKAVVLMPMGGAFNKYDVDIRKYFVENGLIEKVIALPENMFMNTAIYVMMVVLSKNNKNVQFIDATPFRHIENKKNVFTEEDLKAIMEMVKNSDKTDHSNTVSLEQIGEKEYDLTPVKYFQWRQEHEKNMEKLGMICEIKKGANLPQKEFEEVVSKEITKYRAIRISEIKDGHLDDDEKIYLHTIPKKCENGCIKNKCLVISKIPQPLKIAVVEPQNGEIYVMSGNMYAIEPKDPKINLYYLKAYLESEAGRKELDLAKGGRAIPVLALKQLNEVPVYVNEEEQDAFGKMYEQYEKECIKLEGSIKELKSQMEEKRKQMFDATEKK